TDSARGEEDSVCQPTDGLNADRSIRSERILQIVGVAARGKGLSSGSPSWRRETDSVAGFSAGSVVERRPADRWTGSRASRGHATARTARPLVGNGSSRAGPLLSAADPRVRAANTPFGETGRPTPPAYRRRHPGGQCRDAPASGRTRSSGPPAP